MLERQLNIDQLLNSLHAVLLHSTGRPRGPGSSGLSISQASLIGGALQEVLDHPRFKLKEFTDCFRIEKRSQVPGGNFVALTCWRNSALHVENQWTLASLLLDH